MSNLDRLNFQRGLSSQNLNAPYLVLYNSSAKDANATVVRREDFDLEFVVESVTYSFATDTIEEAYYLTAILNSNSINEQMKAFQARGLFGERHVHRKVLDVYFPRFNSEDGRHLELAEMSRDCHIKASQYIKDNPPERGLAPAFLGRLRTDIKKHLVDELAAIDQVVLDIIT